MLRGDNPLGRLFGDVIFHRAKIGRDQRAAGLAIAEPDGAHESGIVDDVGPFQTFGRRRDLNLGAARGPSSRIGGGRQNRR
jgi:hypothetical protein